ncbi:hypothetical protein DIPPA_35638 [Diplonema papillatum]|nr:hypothetical protein DIPPA_35638 [Diplonema papillatum]
MSEIDLSTLVAEHYKLVGALVEKNKETADACIEAIGDEAEEIESMCDLLPLAWKAALEDSAEAQRTFEKAGTRLVETERKCESLKRKVEHLRITEEYTSKFDALLADLASNKTIAELESEIDAERRYQQKHKPDPLEADDLKILKVHLSQLFDMASIAIQKCQFLEEDEPNAKKTKRDSKKAKDSSASPPPVGR